MKANRKAAFNKLISTRRINKHITKTLAWVLCMIMVFSSVNISAYAQTADELGDEINELNVQEDFTDEAVDENGNALTETSTGDSTGENSTGNSSENMEDNSSNPVEGSKEITSENPVGNVEENFEGTDKETINAENQGENTEPILETESGAILQTESGVVLSDEIDTEPEQAFNESVTVEGVEIMVTADEGVFPKGATIEARRVSTSEENDVEEAIGEVREETKNVAASYTFDISIYDEDGNEIEPDTEKGSVKVTFKMAEIANENLEMDVYHIEETDEGLNAENLSVDTDEGEADEAVVETNGFSFYTVEFTYNELQYVLDGDERVELSAILKAVGIKENGEISKVEGSNNELFKPVFEDDIWYIEAIKAFGSEEWLKVTIDGIEYEIVVTDDVTGDWSNLKAALGGTLTESVDGQLDISSDTDVTTIKLLTDFTASSAEQLVVNGNKKLDLNGHVINANSMSKQLFFVDIGVTLTLEDSNSSKANYYTYNKSASWGYIGDTYVGSETPVDYESMSKAILNSGTTVISLPGGAIIGGSLTNSRGSALWVKGTLIMNSGNIVGSKSNGAGGGVGGTIYLDGGEFTMNDGVICGNSTNNCGGGVDAKNSGKFYFKGGIISDNYAQFSNGSAVQIDGNECVFDMSGGRITRNHAGASGSYHYLGSAVLCWNGHFTMTGGEINGNTSDYSTDCAVAVNNVLCSIGGNAKITGNTSCGHDANLYLYSGKTIAFGEGDNAPKSGMSVGVTLANGAGNVTGTSGTGQYAQYFNSDNASYTAVNEGNVVKLSAIGSYVASVTNGSGNTTMYTSLESAISTVNNMDSTTETGTVIKMLRDYATSAPNLQIRKSCTIDLGGYTLSNGYSNNGCLIQTPLSQNGGITIKNGKLSFSRSSSIINTESENAQVLLTCDNLTITGTGNAEGAYVNWGDDVLFNNCRINCPILASGYNSGGTVGTVTYDNNCKIKYNTSLTKDPDWGQEKIIFKESYHQKANVRHYSTDTSEVDLREFIAPGYMWIATPASDPNYIEYPYKVIKSKKVTLVLDNGTVSSSYVGYRKNIGDDTAYCFADSFTLPTASEITRSGYVFDGWYDNAGFSGSKVTSTTEDGKTYYAKWIKDGTIHYSNGIYNGFTPYWKVGNAPADGSMAYGTSFTLPGSTNFSNVGYKLAGWTTIKPTASSATKEYEAGANLSAAQVNELYGKCTNGEITLYAVWERDLTQIAWNEDSDKVYSSTEYYEYKGLGGNYWYKNTGAQYAFGAAVSLADTTQNQAVYVLRDTDLYIDSVANAEIELKCATLDGGIYSANVNGDTVNRSSSLVAKGNYSGFSSDANVRQDTEDNRYIVNRIGSCGGHGIQTYRSSITIKNVVFTYHGTNTDCNGFFSVDRTNEQHSITLNNVKLSNFKGNSTYPMFLTRPGSTDTYTLIDCEITGNDTGSGSVLYVGNFSNGMTKLILKGNTIITGNKYQGSAFNLVVNTPENLTIDDDFSGKISVYLPGGTNMIAALCSTEDRAQKLLNDGHVTTDQNYRLTAEAYNGKGAIRVAKSATVTFNANGGSGDFPTQASVSGENLPITNGKINAYYGAVVTIPGAGTLAKQGNLFMGWNTKADGTGTNYAEGATYTVNADNINLYAVWKNIVASVDNNGTVTYYDTLQKAVDAAVAGDKVKLLCNTKENITIAANKDFALDLNGNVLQGTGSGSVVTINGGAKLTLDDSNANAEHKGTVANYLWKMDDNGSSIIKGGIITGGNSSKGAGVYVNGTFTMNGGTVAGNNATDAGGGVSVESGSFTLVNGTICLNVANYGGGINAGGNAVTIKNGKICNNVGKKNGGGINNNTTLKIEYCEIKDNLVTGNESAQGGGAIFQNNGSTTIEGGIISGNKANVGAGIRLNGWGNGTGIILGGTVQITGNKLTDGQETIQNLYLPDSKTFTIGNGSNGAIAPQTGMSVGITTQTKPTVTNDVNITGTNGSDYSSYFTSDDPAYSVKNDSNILKLVKKVSVVTTAPKAKTNLIYDDSAQELVTAGVAVNGTMYYAIGDALSTDAPDDSAWGTSVPTKVPVGTYRVWYKSKGNTNYSDSTPMYVDVTIAKAQHTVTAPKARILTYNGSEQVLILAGDCATGEILYRLGSTGEYSSDVNGIKAKNAGTYTVYYKVLGNDNYEEYEAKELRVVIANEPEPEPTPDPEPDPTAPIPQPTPTLTPTVTPTQTPKNNASKKANDLIAEPQEEVKADESGEVQPTDIPEEKVVEIGEGTVIVEAVASEESLIKSASVEVKLDELVHNSNVFTEKEIEAIETGADARIWVNVDNMDMSTLSEKEQEDIYAEARKFGGDNVELLYLDVTLFKQVGDGEIVSIHEPGTMVNVTVKVPDSIVNKDPNVVREYCAVRLHEGEVTNLGGTYDEVTQTFTFGTNLFSTYALAYIDRVKSGDAVSGNVASGFVTPFSVILTLLLLTFIVIFIVILIRRKKQEE